MAAFDFLQAHPFFFIVNVALLGLIVGSFLNVVIYRLPRMMQREWREQCCDLLKIEPEDESQKIDLVSPRSHCPCCRHQLSLLDNIPVISYICLKGRCRTCRAKISPQYPLVELLACLMASCIAWRYGFGLHTLFAVLLTWSLICLSLIDAQHLLLPDGITLPFLWLGLCVNMYGIFTDIYSSLIGAVLGYAMLWLVFIGFKKITGKEGMGYGDFKLLAMLGAWLGWQNLPAIILISSVTAVIVSAAMIVCGDKNKNSAFPFGPYLAVAGWITLLWKAPLAGA